MPWEQPLNQILESIQGPVAKVMSVIVIIVTGLTLAFGDTSGGFRRLIQIVFSALSIAFAASSFFLSFFQFGGGALDLMEQSEASPRVLRGCPSRADRTDPARGRATGRRDHQRHARRGGRAFGLRLWIVGAADLKLIGPSRRRLKATKRRIPPFVEVVRRHLRYPQHMIA